MAATTPTPRLSSMGGRLLLVFLLLVLGLGVPALGFRLSEILLSPSPPSPTSTHLAR